MPVALPHLPAPPSVPPPAPAVGATPNAALNIGMGTAAAVGTNTLVASQLGQDVNQVAMGINLIFQFVKQFPKLNQHLWWPVIVLVLGVGAFFWMTQGDLFLSIKQGAAAAFQASMNYHSMRVAGINLLPPATRFPGSET